MSKVGIVGTGNVGWHLAKKFQNLGMLDFVAGRNQSDLDFISENWKVDTCLMDQIPSNSLIIVAVSDDVTSQVCESLLKDGHRVAHSAGSQGISFSNDPKLGVFSPLQTMNKGVSIDFKEVPILIEANSDAFEDELFTLGTKVSLKVARANSETRKKLHLAAVFANNFANQMWHISEKLLIENNFDRTFLHGLIKETVRKIGIDNPSNVQTGPAVRNDVGIIQEQLNALSGIDREIYEVITKSIQEK
jgi:predicted short-subunit dehydrogenase-like oxidoreductase (DUF2520 family)